MRAWISNGLVYGFQLNYSNTTLDRTMKTFIFIRVLIHQQEALFECLPVFMHRQQCLRVLIMRLRFEANFESKNESLEEKTTI